MMKKCLIRIDPMDVSLSGIEVRLPDRSLPLFRIKKISIRSGSKVLLYGPSGIGKTTLLHLIAGLFLPYAGTIQVGEFAISELSDSHRARVRRLHMGMIFQTLNLFDHLTVMENILVALPPKSSFGKEAYSVLDAVGMKGREQERTANLSIGEQQRIAVARILAAKPSLILADEPTSSLDEKNAHSLIEALMNVSSMSTMLLVSHDQRIRSKFKEQIDFEALIRP